MATEDLKSAQITDMDALPRVAANARLSGQHLMVATATITSVLSAAQVGSKYRMVRLPQNAVVHRVFLTSDDMGTTGDTDVGIYLVRGGAVVDANHFATAQDVNAAIRNRIDVTHNGATAGAYVIEKAEQPLWEALGHTANQYPEGYDVVLTITEDTSSVGDMTIEVWYTV